MSRKVALERCKTYDDYRRFAVQHGCIVERAKGAHVKIMDSNGHVLTTMTTHGEPGPHTRSVLFKLLGVLLLVVALACGLAGLVAIL